jgi:hypothetical protein
VQADQDLAALAILRTPSTCQRIAAARLRDVCGPTPSAMHPEWFSRSHHHKLGKILRGSLNESSDGNGTKPPERGFLSSCELKPPQGSNCDGQRIVQSPHAPVMVGANCIIAQARHPSAFLEQLPAVLIALAPRAALNLDPTRVLARAVGLMAEL